MDLLLNTIALDPNRWTADKIPYYTLDRLLPHIAGTPFKKLEVWQHHVSHASDDDIQWYRHLADDLGLTFSILGLYPRLHLEDHARDHEMNSVQHLLDVAGVLGARLIKIFPGNLGTEVVTDAEYDRSIAFMQAMARRAAAANLTITCETHANTLCDTRNACLRFLRDVNAKNVKACYQPYDFIDTAQAIVDYEALAEHIIHVHYQGRKNDEMALLKNADLDYNVLTNALLAQGFDGYLCIEFVKGCVVPTPAEFDLMRVLNNARRDEQFIRKMVQPARRATTAA